MKKYFTLRGVPYVVDYDNAVFHSYDRHSSPFVRKLLGNKLNSLVRGAALVTAGHVTSPGFARRAGAGAVAVVPTVVSEKRYDFAPRKPDGGVRIGWIGSPSNGAYLAPVVAALNELANSLESTLVTVGINAVAGCPRSECAFETHPWSEETEAKLVATFDIGVMPLIDTPWEQGKCGYKLIQYMAAGRPVIASAVGVNSEIVTRDVGRLVKPGADWTEMIGELAADAALRARLGTAARRRVEERYSLTKTAPVIIDRFAGLLGRSSRGEPGVV